jgi:hypothetical protein
MVKNSNKIYSEFSVDITLDLTTIFECLGLSCLLFHFPVSFKFKIDHPGDFSDRILLRGC